MSDKPTPLTTSAPYAITDRWHGVIEQLPKTATLEDAIDRCRWHRKNGRPNADVIGDNMDEDNPSGLLRAERDRAWEGVEDGIDINGDDYKD